MGRFSTGPKTQSINQLLRPGSLRIEELFVETLQGKPYGRISYEGRVGGWSSFDQKFQCARLYGWRCRAKKKFSAIDRLDGLSALGAAVNVFDADLLTVAEACDTHEPSQDWGAEYVAIKAAFDPLFYLSQHADMQRSQFHQTGHSIGSEPAGSKRTIR
ncbi:hypothetical protein N9553_00500 [bacterium]|nr:hypothetical protein [bacterium]